MPKLTKDKLKQVKNIASQRIAAARESGAIKSDKEKQALIRQLASWNGVDMAYDLKAYLPNDQASEKLGLPISDKHHAAPIPSAQPQSRVPAERTTSKATKPKAAKPEAVTEKQAKTSESTVTGKAMKAVRPAKINVSRGTKAPPATVQPVVAQEREDRKTVTSAGHEPGTNHLKEGGMEKDDSPPKDLSYRLEGFDTNCDSYDYAFSPGIPPCTTLDEFGLTGYPIDKEKPNPIWFSGEKDSCEHCFSPSIPPVLSPRDYDYAGISTAPPHPVIACTAHLEGDKTTECNPIDTEIESTSEVKTKPEDTIRLDTNNVPDVLPKIVNKSVTTSDKIADKTTDEVNEVKEEPETKPVSEATAEVVPEVTADVAPEIASEIDTEPGKTKTIVTMAEIDAIYKLIEGDRCCEGHFSTERFEAMEAELEELRKQTSDTKTIVSDDINDYLMTVRGGNRFQVTCRRSMLDPTKSIAWDKDTVSTEVLERLEDINSQYALFYSDGKQFLFSVSDCPAGSYRIITLAIFKSEHRAMGTVTYFQDGKQRRTTYDELWMLWPGHYCLKAGRTFSPDKLPTSIVEEAEALPAFNTYQGFGVNPIDPATVPGAGKLLETLNEFILTHACSGDKELYHWFKNWLAVMVQHPLKKVTTSLVWRGLPGTGKNTLAELILSIVGHHGNIVQDKNDIFGRFNNAMEDCLMLVLDEVKITDKKELARLKAFIANDTINIENKYQAKYTARNLSRFVFLTNDDVCFELETDERRTAVFTFNSVFRAPGNEWMLKKFSFMFPTDPRYKLTGGLWLHELMNRDIRDFDEKGLPPHTAGRAIAMLDGLGTIENWLIYLADRGYIMDSDNIGHVTGWNNIVSVTDAFNSYKQYCKLAEVKVNKTPNSFTIGLDKFGIERLRNSKVRSLKFLELGPFKKKLTSMFKLDKNTFSKD